MAAQTDSFEKFANEHRAPVLRVLCVGLRDLDLAEQATSAALARDFSRRSRVERTEPSAPWLYIEACRYAIRRTCHATAPSAKPGSVERMIEELPQRARLAVLLHHSGLRADEITRALRCSRVEASETWLDALRRLGAEPDDDFDIPEVELDEP